MAISNPRRTLRTSSYTNEEDRVLCQVYLNVSQDNITGGPFWARIETEYHSMLPAHITNTRPTRSLQSRMQIILAAVSKLRACVQEMENSNPGASELDILYKAKTLLVEDRNFRKGFKFDHVWPIMKDYDSKQTPLQRKRANCFKEKSVGSSSFTSKSLDLNDDDESETSAQHLLTSMKEENKKFKQLFDQTTALQQQNQVMLQKSYELQLLRAQNEAKKLELLERREENKILCTNMDLISDPVVREAIILEQQRIVAKRAVAQEQSQGGAGSSQLC